MKQYIGTKIIKAKPGTMAEAQALKCGMPIEQAKRMFRNSGTVDKDGYVVQYEDGYVSWSPKETFEKAYRQCDNMTFGLALEALKKGLKVARKGWKGKGMYLFLAHGEDIQVCIGIEDKCVDVICMKTAQDTVVFGWLASQTDMLAEDWVFVE